MADEDKTDPSNTEEENSEIDEVDSSATADVYNTTHPNRGLAIIFNHYTFDDKAMSPRQGTKKDVSNLEYTFNNLGCNVQTFDDLKYGELYNVLQEVSEMDHSDNSCLVIVALTHGESGAIYAKDHSYKVESLWSPFTGDKCATLVGKPKLFFIQACRGEQVDSGVKISSRSTFVEIDSPTSHYTIPAMADILVMYSTYDGYYSWRNPSLGSWFIESLCKELNKNAKRRDLVTILTFVNRRMAIEYQSNVPTVANMHQKKQIGTIVSTLTRMLYFYLE